ncbi:MAG: alpha/beta hydrolase [Rhabdochlamydiaceae bacterium]|nr:alpha/beta hydrolase [Rhabdochlamydiaceae bacterium]
MPSPEFEKFYQTLKSQVLPSEMTIEEVRAYFTKMMEPYTASKDIAFAPIFFSNFQGVWVKPPKITTQKILLFFHGGAYTTGSWQTHQDVLGRIAKSGECAVCAINYRLAPENPFPAALEDALEAYLTLIGQGHTLLVGGSSAGGGLAIALMLKLKEMNQKLPEAAILLCPWVDLAMKGPSLFTNEGKDIISRSRVKKASQIYLDSHDPKDPLVSPLYGDLKGLPPLLIQAGTIEILWSEIETLVHKAREVQVDVTFQPHNGMFHTWQLFASQIPEGQQAIEEIGRFIKTH